jgi:hypothetical protein
MADRDWDKELAKVDKQLASLSDDQLLKPEPTGRRGQASQPAAPSKAAAVAAEPKPERKTTSFGVYGRLLLSLAAGVCMVAWPYEARCGVGLAGYLAAVAVVAASGIWSAVWTFRHRAPRAHALALLIALWGLTLGAIEVLPRVGYAIPTDRHPATWACTNTVPTKP